MSAHRSPEHWFLPASLAAAGAILAGSVVIERSGWLGVHAAEGTYFFWLPGAVACLVLIGLGWWSQRRLRRQAEDSAADLEGMLESSREEVPRRIQAEEALREAEAKYRSIFENAIEGIYQATPEGRFLTANRALARMLGYDSPEELIATVTDIKTQVFAQPGGRSDIRRLAETSGVGVAQGWEYEVYRKDRSKIWVLGNTRLVRNAAGKLLYYEVSFQDISERKRAEEALRESQRALSTLLSNLPGMAYRRRNDPQWTMEFVSDGCHELTGYHSEDLIGNQKIAYGQLIHPEDRETVWNEVQLALRENRPFQRLYRIRTAHGEEKRVWEQGRGALSAQGGPVRLEGLVIDVTQQRRAEEALQEREGRLRFLVEQMPAIVWTADSELRVTSAMGAGLAALRVDPSGAVGISLIHFLQVDGRETTPIAAHLQALRGGSESYEMSWRGRAFQVHVEPLHGPEGAITGAIGVALDITDRKQAEQALRASEERFRTLIDSLDDVVFTLDREQRHLAMYGRCLERFGLSPQTFLGKTAAEVLGPEAAALHQVANARVLDGEHVVYEWSLESPAGTAHFQTSLAPIRDAKGAVTGIAGVGRDITERKQLEEQLRQAQKMEAIGRLAGGVAHDFNNLLTVVTGYSELALATIPETDPLHAYVQEIQKAGERAASLTRQLLAFGRRALLAPRVLNLNTVVTDMEKLLRRLIGEDIQLITKLDPELRPVKVDPGQVEQVIMNLAVNARDAMPKGGKLTIETTNVILDANAAKQLPEARPGQHALLTVADSGYGMDAKVKAHLFEPFFTTKEIGKGTGLGLATVYGIVQQSDGHVTVESEPGQGAKFRIYLPQVEESAAAPPPSSRPPLTQGKETVLLAEDEDAVRALARQILQRSGYEVLEARNGEEALLLAQSHPGPIQLLVADVVMPELGGYDLAQQLALARPDMKVLYLSGYTDSIIIRRGLVVSRMAFLQKPFVPDELAYKVREVLDR